MFLYIPFVSQCHRRWLSDIKDQGSQSLQQFEFALDLSCSVGVIPEPVDEDLKRGTRDTVHYRKRLWVTFVHFIYKSENISGGTTCMCCLYCSWASYSLCWFFSLSSLVLIKFS